MAKVLIFNIIFRPEPEGGFTVIVPSLPGCITYGKDLKEAKKMAEEAILLYLQDLKEHKEEIPMTDEGLLGQIEVKLPWLKKGLIYG